MINKTNNFQITFFVPASGQRYQVVVKAETCLDATNKCIEQMEVYPCPRISVEVCKQVPNAAGDAVVNITDRRAQVL